MREHLIVALDVHDLARARDLVERLSPLVDYFKVGSELFTVAGREIIEYLHHKEKRIFLDLKFFDIPNTVAAVSRVVAEMGVFMFNVHALGGREMMEATVDVVREACAAKNIARPKIIAVTVLTSMDELNMKQIWGVERPVEEMVLRLALEAKDAGLDGVVASPREVKLIKEGVGQDFLVVTPGIRLASANVDDQKRTLTPSEAVECGSDYLVMGRPITRNPHPATVVRKIYGHNN